ncbi:hypothetical protein GCM10018779_53980 [Streptomyces griseocarneus]|nr:hypothetical protein GCM10018779_53980 [Streptomyces griseocarneus]
MTVARRAMAEGRASAGAAGAASLVAFGTAQVPSGGSAVRIDAVRAEAVQVEMEPEHSVHPLRGRTVKRIIGATLG